MVPRIVNGNGDRESGDACEENLLGTSRSAAANTKTHLTKEGLELSLEIERRKRRFRAAALCCITLAVGAVCAVASYSFEWSPWAASEEWKSHVREMELSPQALYQPFEKNVLYIGIVSAPEHFKQRMLARQRWVDKALTDFHGRVKIEFLVGHASRSTTGKGDDISTQAGPTSQERETEKRLKDEAALHSDVFRIPVGASPLSASDRVMWILENALRWKARFVIKATDEEMVAVDKTVARLEQHSPIAPPVYFGQVWRSNTMQEADGGSSWFFEGCYGISGGLAHQISVVHAEHTIGFPMFGSTNADVNVAKWVNFEDDLRRKSDILPVRHVWMPHLCSSMVYAHKDADELRPTLMPQDVDDGVHMHTDWETP